MPEFLQKFGRPAGALTRRGWLVGSLIGGIGLCARGEGASNRDEEDVAAEVAAIQARAHAVKLQKFRSSRSGYYLGISNAAEDFRKQALKICNELAAAYQKHFREKGFAVEFPDRLMTVVILKDKSSYEAFVGEPAGASVGGHYDPETQRLFIFDFRPGAEDLATAPARINTITLVHESLHQLTFNTGLLDRRGDVPLCISEGLATYGERWQAPPRRSVLGLLNKDRLDVINNQPNQEWIPLEQLITQDALFANAATEQLAYAEAWLLIYYLMKPSARFVPKFRAYLEAIRGHHGSARRLKDAREHLGDLERLDRTLRQQAIQLG